MSENSFNYVEWWDSLTPKQRADFLKEIEEKNNPEDFVGKAKKTYQTAIERYRTELGLEVNQNQNFQRLVIGLGSFEKAISFFKSLGFPESILPKDQPSVIISNVGKIGILMLGEGSQVKPFTSLLDIKTEEGRNLTTRIISGLAWETRTLIYFKLDSSEELFIANETGDVEKTK